MCVCNIITTYIIILELIEKICNYVKNILTIKLNISVVYKYFKGNDERH